MKTSQRPIKTNGYACRPFGAERRKERRGQANMRQVAYDSLTLDEKIASCVSRGSGAREMKRLEAQQHAAFEAKRRQRELDALARKARAGERSVSK